MSVEAIAIHLGVSKETVYRWLDKGKIPASRVGKLWKFKYSEVDNWVRNGGADSSKKLAPEVNTSQNMFVTELIDGN